MSHFIAQRTHVARGEMRCANAYEGVCGDRVSKALLCRDSRRETAEKSQPQRCRKATHHAGGARSSLITLPLATHRCAKQLITSGNKLKNLDTEIFQLHLHPLGEHLLALFGGKGEKLGPILYKFEIDFRKRRLVPYQRGIYARAEEVVYKNKADQPPFF